MTTREKLNAFEVAYRMHLKAIRNNDPLAGEMEAPHPRDYDLHGIDEWAAFKIAQRLTEENDA